MSRKQFSETGGPVVEDRVEPVGDGEAPYERREWAARDAVPDVVEDLSPAADRRQAVRVLPQRVRPGDLHVGEAARRSPVSDLGLPRDRYTEQPQPVAELGSSLEPGRCVDDAEAQPGRRDRLEVARIGEEGERRVEWPADDLRPLERERQRRPPRSW